ncbi:MAG: ADP-ribosylation factor-like protein [Promethearchaeota archaeon]
MLRQFYIIRNDKILYKREYAKGLDKDSRDFVFSQLKEDAFASLSEDFKIFDYYKTKISYIVDKPSKLLILFITDLDDDHNRIKTEITKFKTYFMNVFDDSMNSSALELLDPIIDAIHRKLKPKISIVGFSGVGKTTIIKLIRAEEIPAEHIPTINGERSTIKIGNLEFNLWDFAGQDQFSFLWNKFIVGSDAVLLITDSTLENIEKSKYFLTLISEEAPYAHVAVIANKQDINGALHPKVIEEHFGLKTYSMVAIDPENRNKMIQIIADVLEMNGEVSPLLQPLFIRDRLIDEAQTALEQGDLKSAAEKFQKIGDLCITLGDYSLGNEIFNKLKQIEKYISSLN